MQDCVTELSDLTGRKFGTIYADPPWRYGNTATRAAAGNHYATMTVDEICDMPISSLAATDAHIHLWVTNAFLFEAPRIFEAWGFDYRGMLVWVKPQMGLGNYWRVSHELLLLGVRGNAKRFNDHSKRSTFEARRTKHSRKPDVVRRIIEDVSPGPYLELFGRTAVDNWTVYGNEISPERMLF